MTEWNKDIELARKMMPFIDRIYGEIFNPQFIIRMSGAEIPHPLDQYFGIDGWIELKSGCIITFQETIRRYEAYKKYNDFTIEHWSNVPLKRKGDWFHIAAEFYFYGYVNKEETMIIDWHIVRLFSLKLWVTENWSKFRKRIEKNKKHSRADFLYFSWEELPKEFILKEARDK